MSDDRTLDLPGADEPDVAAAELALGLLEGEERARAIRRVLAEPGFAGAVEQWRQHFAQLFDLWPEVEPRDIFARVERSLDAPAASPVALPQRAPSRWWPALAALSSLAAAILLAVLVTRPLPTPPAPPPTVAVATPPHAPVLVASLDPEAAGAPVTVVYDAPAGAIRLTEAKLGRANRSAELWIIPADGKPYPLGLLKTQGVTALVLTRADRARIAAGATLAVSLEPIGGSPTGLPTGPIVAKGAITQV